VQSPAGKTCRVELSYVGPDGGALSNDGGQLAQEFVLAPGVASSLDFQTSSNSQTTFARPVIRQLGTPGASPHCGIVTSAELMDSGVGPRLLSRHPRGGHPLPLLHPRLRSSGATRTGPRQGVWLARGEPYLRFCDWLGRNALRSSCFASGLSAGPAMNREARGSRSCRPPIAWMTARSRSPGAARAWPRGYEACR
jgi:hypothetical protein